MQIDTSKHRHAEVVSKKGTTNKDRYEEEGKEALEELSDDETVKTSSKSRGSKVSFQSTNTSIRSKNTVQMKMIIELQESVKIFN